jgi:hypothetical protein
MRGIELSVFLRQVRCGNFDLINGASHVFCFTMVSVRYGYALLVHGLIDCGVRDDGKSRAYMSRGRMIPPTQKLKIGMSPSSR